MNCGCGSNQGIHELGNNKCFREIVPKDEEPKKVNKGWSMPGNDGERYTITDFTLYHQRGYGFSIQTNQWHRPKERNDDWFESKGWD